MAAVSEDERRRVGGAPVAQGRRVPSAVGHLHAAPAPSGLALQMAANTFSLRHGQGQLLLAEFPCTPAFTDGCRACAFDLLAAEPRRRPLAACLCCWNRSGSSSGSVSSRGSGSRTTLPRKKRDCEMHLQINRSSFFMCVSGVRSCGCFAGTGTLQNYSANFCKRYVISMSRFPRRSFRAASRRKQCRVCAPPLKHP